MDLAVIACIAAGIAAAVHGYIFVLETLRWEEPGTRHVFGTTAEQAAQSKQLAANQGVYNLLLGVAALAGVVAIVAGARVPGLAVLLTATGIMLAAALYLVVSDRTKARPAVVQGFFPAVAVITGLIALGQAG
jgi:putative membrane protein